MASRPSPSPTDSMGRSRLVPVSSSLVSNSELDLFPDSAYSSPGSTQLSPASPTDQTRSESCKDSDSGAPGHTDLDPASGPQRTRSSAHSSSAAGPSEPKEKRKRSRVTPEQLAHLERLFATDRSPTAARRKEISEMLGMQERQTQIWFQNRRAKAKLQESRREHGDIDHPPDYIPSLVAGSDAELYFLVHEDEPISVIPCIELSIGTWKRVISGPGKFDLVAYCCESQKRLTWYIHSAGQGFKMEVPFASIADTKFANTATPGMGQASFILSRPPVFYLEHVVAAPPDPVMGTAAAAVRTWKRCADWTEDMQASAVLQHDLVGAAVQLAHVLRNIAAYTAGPSIPLYPPAYHHPLAAGLPGDGDGALPHQQHPQQLPAAAVAGPAQMPHFGYADSYGLRRRFSTPALIQPHSIRHFPTGAGAQAGAVFPAPYAGGGAGGGGAGGGMSEPGMSPASSYSDVSGMSTSPARARHPDDVPRLPISQSITRRSFAGPSLSSSYGEMRPGTAGGGSARPYSSGGIPASMLRGGPVDSPFLLRRASSTTWEPGPMQSDAAAPSPYMSFAEGGMDRMDTTMAYPPAPGDYQPR